MGDEIGVDPIDNAGVDIGYLEQRWSLGVPGAAIDPNHIGHPPSPIRVSDDHGHSRLDMQKDRIRRGRRNAAPMINRHSRCASTQVLAQNIRHCCDPIGGLHLRKPVLSMGQV